MKLKPGKQYLTRDGDVVTITAREPQHAEFYQFAGSNRRNYTSDGRADNLVMTNWDIISRYRPECSKCHEHACKLAMVRADEARIRTSALMFMCCALPAGAAFVIQSYRAADWGGVVVALVITSIFALVFWSLGRMPRK